MSGEFTCEFDALDSWVLGKIHPEPKLARIFWYANENLVLGIRVPAIECESLGHHVSTQGANKDDTYALSGGAAS